MRVVASGVETCLSHAHLSLDTYVQHLIPQPAHSCILNAHIEIESPNEHVRIQASLRHAMAQCPETYSYVRVVCTVTNNPKSGDKRKVSSVDTVTYVLLEL